MSEPNSLIDPNNIEAAQQALDRAKAAADTQRSAIEAAQAAGNDAKSGLQVATEACKAKASSRTVSDKAVATEILANTTTALENARTEAQPVLKAEGLARSRLEYATNLRTVRALNLDALVARVLAAESELRTSIAELTSQLETHKQAVHSVVSLAEHLNIQPDVRSYALEDVKRRILAELQRKYDRTPTISHWIGYTT